MTYKTRLNKMITVTEIYDFNCDKGGVLTVAFHITGDPVDTYRELKTDAYFQWAKESDDTRQYHFIEQICDHPDEHGHSEYVFDFAIWEEYEHNEETVKEFLEDSYGVEELSAPQAFE